MKISQVEWGTVGKAAIKEYSKDDVPGLAAEMAYWVVFSIFPFFAFLATLLGIFGTRDLLDSITQDVLSPLPPDTQSAVRGPLENLINSQGGGLSIGALVSAVLALNSASSAVDTMLKAFNRAYGVEETRNFVMKKLTSLALTFVLALLLVGGTIFLSLGGALANLLDLGRAGEIGLLIVRIVGALLGITLALAILYWKGPNLDQKFQFITPGSVVATVALLVFSGLFGLYVSFLAGSSANKTYGTLAGVILFLIFLRFASTIILLGAEFNAEAAKRYDPAVIKDKITDPRKQLPGQQAMPHPQAMREAGVTPQQVAESNRRSAQKLVAGEGSPATAALPAQAQANGNGAAPVYATGDFDDPSLDERLRAIRERPFVSAAEQARDEQAHLSGTERAQRVRTTLATFAVSAATAIGGVVFGTLRRANR